MQVAGEAVRRNRGALQRHDPADLSAMQPAVDDQMHRHLLARHPSRRAVGEGEIDALGEPGVVEVRHIVDQVPVAGADRLGELRQGRRVGGVGGVVAMAGSAHVRGEDPVDGQGVAERSDGDLGGGRFAVELLHGAQRRVVRPGLVFEQPLEGSGVTHGLVS